MRMRPLVRSAALAALCCSASCSAPPPPPPEVRALRAAAAEAFLLPDEVSFFGVLDWARKADLSAPVEGVLEALPVAEGGTVRAGDVVAVLSNPQLVLAAERAADALAQAEAAVDLARARLSDGAFAAERSLVGLSKNEAELVRAREEAEEARRKQADLERLAAAGGVSAEAVKDGAFSLAGARHRASLLEFDARSALIGFRVEDLPASAREGGEEALRAARLAQACASLAAEAEAAGASRDARATELRSARRALEDLTLRSPLDGRLGPPAFEAGERVKAGDRVLSVLGSGKLRALCEVGEAQALRLAPGQTAELELQAASLSASGRVEAVSGSASGKGTFSVKVALASAPPRLGAGLFARVRVKAGRGTPCAAVPAPALLARPGGAWTVFELRGGVLKERTVQRLAVLDDGRAAVLGLEAGSVLAAEADASLKEGDRARALR